jgi:hypothetical protein
MTGPDTSLIGGVVTAAATLLLMNYFVGTVAGQESRLSALAQLRVSFPKTIFHSLVVTSDLAQRPSLVRESSSAGNPVAISFLEN